MVYKWENVEERVLRHLRMSPLKKMEWLREMNEFKKKYAPKISRVVHRKLKENFSKKSKRR